MSKFKSLLKRIGSAKEAFRSPLAWEEAKKDPNNSKEPSENPSDKEQKTEVKEIDFKCKSIKSLLPKYCCGCGACYNLCPTGAITMVYNDEGFLEPKVNDEKCIKCGLCKNRCPSINTKYENLSEPTCYAAYGSDEIREKSSSGGLFTLLAQSVFDKGGYVCGAGYTDDLKVEHMIIKSPDELDKLRFSKYVQSDANTVYRQIGKLLKENKYVLFCGCGCQVAGLYAYLGERPEKLISIDLMCHGGPSPKLFEKYLKEYHKKPVKRVGFRDKDFYGWSTEMTVEYQDGEIYRQRREVDPFYRAFLPCISVREFCGECSFSTLPRQGDITLADFWGISKYNPNYTDGKGTSIVSINSEIGKKAFEEIKDKLVICAQVPCDDIKKTGQPYQHPFKRNEQRYIFFDLIKKGASIEKALNYAQNRKFDVAIMGVWFGCNYGSVATYYALMNVVESFGLNVLMVDKCYTPNSNSDPEFGRSNARIFAETHGYNISRHYWPRDLRELNRHVDIFLMGSDQMWHRGINRFFGFSFYFDFVEDEKKKIAYATSIGHPFDFAPEPETTTIKHYLHRFDSVSMRESSGVKFMKEKYDLDATQVLDPVFIAEREIFDKVAEESRYASPDYSYEVDEDICFKERSSDGFITAYILNPSEEKKKVIEWISQKLNKPVRIMLDGWKKNFEENSQKMGLTCVKDLNEGDWIYNIKNCDFLFTDSCHGLSFGILYNKPLIAIANLSRGATRFFSLVELLGLESHLVRNEDIGTITEHEELLEPIDYEPVNKKLKEEKDRSLKWLENAIFSTKKIKSNAVYSVYDERLEDKTNE